MIVTEIVTIRRKQYRKTYSDDGYYIRKVGTEEEYTEALDRLTSDYTYEETERKIEQEGEEYEY